MRRSSTASYGGLASRRRHVIAEGLEHQMTISGDGFVTLADGTLRWGRFGAAPHRGEPPVEGALREFAEEVGAVLAEGDFSVAEIHEDDHGGWSYWTVVVDVPERFGPPAGAALNWETAETGWVPHHRLAGLELHGAFRRTLVRLGFLD